MKGPGRAPIAGSESRAVPDATVVGLGHISDALRQLKNGVSATKPLVDLCAAASAAARRSRPAAKPPSARRSTHFDGVRRLFDSRG